jgi:hypothetical protein
MTEVDRLIERRASVLDRARAGRDRGETYPPSGRPARNQYRLSKAGVEFADVLRTPAGTNVPRARSTGSLRSILGEAV